MAIILYSVSLAIASVRLLPTVEAVGNRGNITFSYLSASELVKNYLRDPNGLVEFRNIRSSNHSCFALFANGHSAGKNQDTKEFLIPDEGVMLSSGKPDDFNGQDSDQSYTDFGNDSGDVDLESQVPGAKVFDSCFIEFEFRCPPSTAVYTPEVNFDYVFGSEEYNEYVFSEYNDAFGFFLNGKNIALVPGTFTPVSINNVNNEINADYFVSNILTGRGNVTSPYPFIEADGFTKKMTAIAQPLSEWNVIKIVTGDISDGILDSWVLLEAGTFSCVRRTETPSILPSESPSLLPTSSPSNTPTNAPSTFPTASPSAFPTLSPVMNPTSSPSMMPSLSPSYGPSSSPSTLPSMVPSKSPSSLPTLSPTTKPTLNPTISITSQPSTSMTPSWPYPCGLTPCDRAKALTEFYSSISNATLFENPSSPQSLALDWIINHDAMAICPNDSNLCHMIQRYVMAVFYFSTKGYQWTNCSASKDYYCDEENAKANENCNIVTSVHSAGSSIGHVKSTPWLSPSHECFWGGCSCQGEDYSDLAYCLEQIQFEGNGLRGTLPTEIASLKSLKYLSLENESLTGTIPSALGALHNLEVIDLDYNQLTGKIPGDLYAIQTLHELDLNNNALTGTLSTLIGHLSNLRTIQIDHNFFTGTIPSEIGTLKNLEVGFFSYNNFSGSVAESICALRSPGGALNVLQVDCAIEKADVNCSCCSSCRQE